MCMCMCMCFWARRWRKRWGMGKTLHGTNRCKRCCKTMGV